VSWGAQGDSMSKAAALIERGFAVNAAHVVFAAFSSMDDAASCCAPKSWFDFADFPSEIFYCHYSSGMFRGVSNSWWTPSGPEPSALEAN
jgi:hypothetical protein